MKLGYLRPSDTFSGQDCLETVSSSKLTRKDILLSNLSAR